MNQAAQRRHHGAPQHREPGDERHFLQIEGMSRARLQGLIEHALDLRARIERKESLGAPLAGRTLASLFFENSTRTKASFEQAARALGAGVMAFDVGTSSVAKGETLADTVRTIEALGADFIAMRHPTSGAARFAARCILKAAVLNGGDGMHEHPSQALLDAAVLTGALGSLAGKRVAIVGDVLHSRVARSNRLLLPMLGAKVTLVGPPWLVPPGLANPGAGVKVQHDLMKGLSGADVVYILRVQFERMKRALLPSVDEYRAGYSVTMERLNKAAPDALVMHPGPVNRGVEASSEVLDCSRSFVQQQVTTGVAARAAILLDVSGLTSKAGSATKRRRGGAK